MNPPSRQLLGRLRATDWVTLGLVAYGVPVVLWLLSGIGQRDHHAALVDLVLCPPGVAASLLCLRASRRGTGDARMRGAWALLGLGCLAYTFGMVSWLVIEGVFGGNPFPSIADLGPLGWYPLAFAALLAMPRNSNVRDLDRRSVLFDGVVLVLGVGAMVWAYLLIPVSAQAPSDLVTLLVSTAFATWDLLLLAAVLHADLRTRNMTAVRPVLLGVAFVLAGDIVYALVYQQGAARTSGFPDVFYCAAWVAIALGARHAIASADSDGRTRSIVGSLTVDRSFSLLPYAAITIGVTMLVWVGIRDLNTQTGAMTLCAVAVTVMLTLRQSMVVSTNNRAISEARAREGWTRFVRLLEHGTDMILLIDAGGVIRHATPSTERMLGRTPEQIVGIRVDQLADPALFYDRMIQAMARPLDAPGEPLEMPFRLPDGTEITLELVATKTLDEHQAPVLVVNVRDVTERHAVMEAVRKSEALNRAILDAMPDHILRFDGRGRFLGAAGALSPGSPFTEDAIGRTFADVLPPTLARTSEEALQRARETGRMTEISYSTYRPGGPLYFETRFVPLGDEEFLALARDVTNMHETSVGLQRLAHILDATPDIVCSFDWDGRITYTNEAFRALVRMPANGAPMLVDTVLAQFPKVRQAMFEDAIPDAISNGFWRGDLDFETPAVTIPISVIVLAHGGSREATRSISLVGRDISANRQTERALTEAKEAADEASRAKGEFLATMSHEIRTPMNGIIGAAELLLGTELSEEQREFALTLHESSESLLGIISDVLDFSKIEAKSLDLERIPFDLRRTIEGALGVVGGAAARKGLEVVAEVETGVPSSFRGDPARLRQVLINLAGNAVKFTERGRVTVRVASMRIPDDRRHRVLVEVTDTGIGISPEAQSRLFQPFAQADGSMSRRFGGTGLGLAISQRLVTLMGGEMGVRSESGSGSTFWFSVPLEVDRRAASAAGRSVRGRSPGMARSEARVLLVEDNEVNRKVVGAILRRLGYAPDVVPDGYEAVRIVESRTYDVILMDCQMPGMDGFEATRLIRTQEAGGRHIPIVAITANATAADRDRCLTAGMDDYLAKPVRLEAIRHALARWLPSDADSSDDTGAAPVRPIQVPAVAGRPAAILDPATLASLRELGDPGEDVLGPLMELFFSQASLHLATISAALGAADPAGSLGAAHTLKGAARNVGAMLIGDVAARLEERARAGAGDLAELEAELTSAIAVTRTAYEAVPERISIARRADSQPTDEPVHGEAA